MTRTSGKRLWIAFATSGIIGSVLLVSPIHGQPIDGVGELKFGMTPNEVAALDGCSSQTECLYEILGKNRYFRLVYRPERPTPATPPSQPPGTLSLIDIDMGTYTRTWFLELMDVLASQFPVIHSPTERENAMFRQGKRQELIIGLADGGVLLKIVRRPFGNLILRVIYQDADNAKVQRALWNASQTS